VSLLGAKLGVSLIFAAILGLSGCTSVPGFVSSTSGSIKELSILSELGFTEQSPNLFPFRSWVRSGTLAVDSRDTRLLSNSVTAAGPQSRLFPIMVVFESDGAPWRALGYFPPPDPTPRRPVGAEIARALAQRFPGPVIYLGRHCQFLIPGRPDFSRRCTNSRLWARARFAPEVVSDFRQWLLHLVEENPGLQDRPWLLTGFSGGGTIAALLATELPETKCLVTFAAPLDLRDWAQLQNLSPLYESLDPADRSYAISRLPELGIWLGNKDRVSPPASIGRLAIALGSRQEAIRLVDDVSHGSLEDWIGNAATRIQNSCNLDYVEYSKDTEPSFSVTPPLSKDRP